MEKICPKCAEDPTVHSFRKICEKNSVHLFYTNPTKARLYKDTDGILAHYTKSLEEIGEDKWSWVFDSEGFNMKHAMEVRTGIGIAKLITGRFGKNLEEITIINPTWHISVMLRIVWPFLTEDTRRRVKVKADRYYSVLEFI